MSKYCTIFPFLYFFTSAESPDIVVFDWLQSQDSDGTFSSAPGWPCIRPIPPTALALRFVRLVIEISCALTLGGSNCLDFWKSYRFINFLIIAANWDAIVLKQSTKTHNTRNPPNHHDSIFHLGLRYPSPACTRQILFTCGVKVTGLSTWLRSIELRALTRLLFGDVNSSEESWRRLSTRSNFVQFLDALGLLWRVTRTGRPNFPAKTFSLLMTNGAGSGSAFSPNAFGFTAENVRKLRKVCALFPDHLFHCVVKYGL